MKNRLFQAEMMTRSTVQDNEAHGQFSKSPCLEQCRIRDLTWDRMLVWHQIIKDWNIELQLYLICAGSIRNQLWDSITKRADFRVTLPRCGTWLRDSLALAEWHHKLIQLSKTHSSYLYRRWFTKLLVELNKIIHVRQLGHRLACKKIIMLEYDYDYY